MLLILQKKPSENIPTVNLLTEKAGVIPYPYKIENVFPYWASIKKDPTQPNLIDLLKEYYNWLYSDTTTNRSGTPVNEYFGFFNLDKLKDFNNATTDFNFKFYLNTYLPELNQDLIGSEITHDQAKNILNAVKLKLYNKKGTEISFKYLISLIFGVAQSDVWITYPKKYLMVLNGGTTKEVPGIDIGLRGILNFSVLPDVTYWNNFSYIINVSGIGSSISSTRYEKVLKPFLHPVGTNDNYQERPEIFNKQNENFDLRIGEVPVIGNYLDYTFQSISDTYACSKPQGYIQFVFPSWDKQIKRYTGTVNFARINIQDFLFLEPDDPEADNAFPNDSLTCP